MPVQAHRPLDLHHPAPVLEQLHLHHAILDRLDIAEPKALPGAPPQRQVRAAHRDLPIRLIELDRHRAHPRPMVIPVKRILPGRRPLLADGGIRAPLQNRRGQLRQPMFIRRDHVLAHGDDDFAAAILEERVPRRAEAELRRLIGNHANPARGRVGVGAIF